MSQKPFTLRAIVAVPQQYRVRCQQPHCGHSVYARIHVVEEEGQFLVLGSDCFAKRYDVGNTTAFRGFGSGTSTGRVLSDEERMLLENNTQALLTQFELEHQREIALEAIRLEALHQAEIERQLRTAPRYQPLIQQETNQPVEPELPTDIQMPTWAALKKPKTSFFAYGNLDGQCWVLMQSGHHDGCFIAPAPIPFESWDEALPPSLGVVDKERQVYASPKDINELTGWFSGRRNKGSRIDSDAIAIQKFALQIANDASNSGRK